MPNHVTNILTFNGSTKDVEDLRNAIKGIDSDGEEQAIDFSKIIPMPPELMITSGSLVDYGIAVILFRERGDDSKLKPVLDYPWVKAENITNAEQLANHLVENNKADLIQGKQALDNSDKHGFKDWYTWSIANWGTKWNALDPYLGRCRKINESVMQRKIRFSTAWSPPTPIILAASIAFPSIEFELCFYDASSALQGKYVYVGGEEIHVEFRKYIGTRGG